jgi:hypothetical protein
MCHASRNRAHRATCAKSYCGEIVTEFTRLVAEVVERAATKSATGSIAPALGGGIVEHRTRMRGAGTDGNSSATRTECDCNKGIAHFCNGVADVIATLGAETPRRTDTPADHVVGVTKCAGMCCSGGNCLRDAPTAEINYRQSTSHLIRLIAARQLITASQTAVPAKSPALHRAV